MKAKFLKAVDENDLVSVRLFIANELLLDPRGASFSEMRALAESKFNDLYEASDAKDYPANEDIWDEAFLFSVKNDLDANFSKERLSFYESVAKVVLKEKAILLNKEEKSKASTDQNAQSNENQSYYENNNSNNKKIFAGVAVGGVAIAVAGICMSKLAVTSIGIIGAAVGGYLLYKEGHK